MLQVYKSGAWGTACNKGFLDGAKTCSSPTNNAIVACRALLKPTTVAQAVCVPSPSTTTNQAFEFDCNTGKEAGLAACSPSASRCPHNSDVGVACRISLTVTPSCSPACTQCQLCQYKAATNLARCITDMDKEGKSCGGTNVCRQGRCEAGAVVMCAELRSTAVQAPWATN